MSSVSSAEVPLKIDHVDRMPPFLISVLSATDLWMFVTSNGGLTAGRVDASQALFPYETVDRLYQRPGLGGPFTGIRLRSGQQDQVWLPFLDEGPAIQTQLQKSRWGDRVVFETHHAELGLSFEYTWAPSERYGWVRSVALRCHRSEPVELDVIDGLLDVMPAGVQLSTQQRASNLVDAYRHTELDEASGLALYSLSSLIVDRAEPAAALHANSVWSFGLKGSVGLTADAIRAWKTGQEMPTETHARGRKGAHLTRARLQVAPQQVLRWGQVADVSLDGIRAAALRQALREGVDAQTVAADVEATHRALERVTAASDGLQDTGDDAVVTNHLANALFNSFRGGVVVGEGTIASEDFIRFVRSRNRRVAERVESVLQRLPEKTDLSSLREQASQTADTDFRRLVDEYLPLAFSRRHGDPSRPWNQFNIRTRDERGKPVLSYEGNWRDIFQNWEALALSYPAFLPSMIAKFVNAMTPDGYNPYRISRDGIDWEVPEPDDPWSNIGYWGDHQIIYLLRLLEHLNDHDPAALRHMLVDPRFSFADVPYRIVSYDDIIRNPRDTIRFDEATQAETERRTQAVGADGRLVHGPDGVVHVTLWEKLIIAVLTKLSNLVVDGGVWMNTQRPEWNDANNALAGPGLSVVTLAQTLRMVRFLRSLPFPESLSVHAPVAEWLAAIAATLAEHRHLREGEEVSPRERRSCLDRLGRAFDRYREQIYGAWSHGQDTLTGSTIDAWLADAEATLADGLARNRRPDGLFHAYNTLILTVGEARVNTLSIMLEGQVAAIDSGALQAEQVADLVARMYESPLYVEDQNSFLLYPDRTLPDLLERNKIPPGRVDDIPWIASERAGLVAQDVDGHWRFRGQVPNAAHLAARMDELEKDPALTERVQADREAVLALYEETFHHDTFTGRSGWMYGYEGLGCIYWHMVAKLLVAIQQSFFDAEIHEPEAAANLARTYERVRAGFGFNKSDRAYGAFHTDPYSHTPGQAGAQQPGMTGQVKEQLITRFGELGLRVRGGRVRFQPRLLWEREFLPDEHTWSWVDANGDVRTIQVPAHGLAFLWTGVPVVYRAVNGEERIEIEASDGTVHAASGLELDVAWSQALLQRTGQVRSLRVDVPRSSLRDGLQ